MKRFMLLFVALVALVASPVTAQWGLCPGDDGLSIPGTCCIPAFPGLPALPGIQMPVSACTWNNCTPVATWTNTVLVSPPFQVFSDLWVGNLTIVAGPVQTNTGLLVMKYARTWMEANPVAVRQVWRFIVNCDANFVLSTASTSPVPTPPCAFAGVPVHLIGHIDYALDCFSGQWSEIVSLTHMCGAFMHGPGSQSPLSPPFDHPDFAYSFVGPAPFFFGPTTPMAGPIIGESQRSTQINLNAFMWQTMAELPIFGGFLNPAGGGCPGAPVGSFAGWTDYNCGFGFGCSSAFGFNFNPVPLPPLLPTGLSAMSLGTFGHGPLTFASTKEVEVWLGVVAAQDPCPSSGFNLPFHIVTGVSTHGGTNPGIGFPQWSGVGISTDKWIDLQNMLIPNSSAPMGLMLGIGSVFAGSQMWNINVP